MVLIFHLIYFLIISFFCFIIPGLTFLNLIEPKRCFFEKVVLATVLGFVVYSLISYFCKLVQLPWVIFIFLIVINLLFIKSEIPHLKKITFPKLSIKLSELILFIIVLLTGVAGQMLIIAPSGSLINGNLSFWSALGHDGIWHIALIEEMKNGFPLQNPVLAGERLVNYHFFSDLAAADFSQFLGLSSLDLHFRFFPLLFSILLGALSFILGHRIGKTFLSGVWAMFFTFFAGSFGYIVTWLQSRSIGGESLFWATQIQSSSGNPPQIAAFVILLAFIISFIDYINSKKKLYLILCILLAGSLTVFKVYAGAVAIGSLLATAFVYFLVTRKIELGLMFICSLVLTLALYLPNTSRTDQFLIWEPWWFVRTMVVAPDRLNLLDWELKRQTYFAEHNIKRVIQLEVIAFLIFFFGNLGMRFLGLVYLPQIIKNLPRHFTHQLLIYIALSSLILPLLFLQKGVASNMIQSMQYFLLILGIFAGVATASLIRTIKLPFIKIILAAVIIVLAIPTQLGLLYSFYNRPPFAHIDQQELEALSFLKNNTTKESIILTPPYQKFLNLNQPVNDIWDWSDTAYVTALSGRRTYLSDTEQVEIMGYLYQQRFELQQTIFSTKDQQVFEETLKKLPANYLYYPKALRPQIDLSQSTLIPLFTNNKVEIWKINK